MDNDLNIRKLNKPCNKCNTLLTPRNILKTRNCCIGCHYNSIKKEKNTPINYN